MASRGDPGATGGHDRRDEERTAILGELHGDVLVLQPVAITEIGRRGLQVETTFPFQLDSLHEFRLVLGDTPIVATGRVTHCSIMDVDQECVRYRSGIHFVELPERIAETIARFVDAIECGRRGL